MPCFLLFVKNPPQADFLLSSLLVAVAEVRVVLVAGLLVRWLAEVEEAEAEEVLLAHLLVETDALLPYRTVVLLQSSR